MKSVPGTNVFTEDTWQERLKKHLYLFGDEEIEFIMSKVAPEIRLVREEERNRIDKEVEKRDAEIERLNEVITDMHYERIEASERRDT